MWVFWGFKLLKNLKFKQNSLTIKKNEKSKTKENKKEE